MALNMPSISLLSNNLSVLVEFSSLFEQREDFFSRISNGNIATSIYPIILFSLSSLVSSSHSNDQNCVLQGVKITWKNSILYHKCFRFEISPFSVTSMRCALLFFLPISSYACYQHM